MTSKDSFHDSGWGDADYDREYRDGSDVFIQERDTLLRIVASFFRTFVASKRRISAEPIRILDLGCGDGVLAETLCAEAARIDVAVDFTVTDGSAEMLDAARVRLAAQPISAFHRATFEEIIAGEFQPAPFDLIVSSFAIHHLETAQKAALFERLLSLLSPGGYFLNTDVVLADSIAYTEWYFTLWREWIARRQRRLGLSEDFTGVPDEARAKDENHYDPLNGQLEDLSRAGFTEVACHYRYGLFAVFGAQRAGG
jgi:tRNA (cmo5U34)-methyltransferase